VVCARLDYQPLIGKGARAPNPEHADQHVTFDVDDHFAQPQSNGTALLKKRSPPWNTVSLYIALFRRNMKQNRLEKQNFKKSTANVQMLRAVRVKLIGL